MNTDAKTAEGLVHIYTGDGKGKTTAAIGLLVRACGAGMRTLFCQFLKGRDTAELAPLRAMGVEVLRTEEVKKFVAFMDEAEKKACVKSHEVCYNKVKSKILSGEYGLVVLDEAMAAMRLGLLDEEDLADLIRTRPRGVELVLTGRDAPDAILSLADYVSDIRAVKHPYERGVQARRGIEY